MMDGDAAGKKAAKMIYSGIRKFGNTQEVVTEPLHENFDVTVFKLWDYEIVPSCKDGSYDAGNAPKSIIRDLQRVCDGQHHSSRKNRTEGCV